MNLTLNNKEPDREPTLLEGIGYLLILVGGIGLVIGFLYFLILILAAFEPWQR